MCHGKLPWIIDRYPSKFPLHKLIHQISNTTPHVAKESKNLWKNHVLKVTE